MHHRPERYAHHRPRRCDPRYAARLKAKSKRHWGKVSRSDKRWARSTAQCESGGDPKAIGGGGAYRGAFQFLLTSWKYAPKSPGGDPISYSYRTRDVEGSAHRLLDARRISHQLTG